MKRVCIFSVYDKDGVVDDALLFFLDSLKPVLDRLVICVIGFLLEEEKKKLERFTKEIFFKENVGFDAAAIKFILRNYLSLDELKHYDELVIANDTDFGPFVPFSEIFETMQNKQCDFWGVNLYNCKLMPHIQSDFRVFKRNMFPYFYNYMMSEISEHETDRFTVASNFEIIFYRKARLAGFKSDAYNTCNYDVYKSTYFALIEDKYPFLKARALSLYDDDADQYNSALEYVKIHYNYDLRLIVEKVRRKYNVHIRPMVAKQILCADEEEFINFVDKNKSFYIYGAGNFARRMYLYYEEYMSKLKGFVVSNPEQTGTLFGLPIVPFSNVFDLETPMFVALSLKNTEEVSLKLKDFKNILFLNIER